MLLRTYIVHTETLLGYLLILRYVRYCFNVICRPSLKMLFRCIRSKEKARYPGTIGVCNQFIKERVTRVMFTDGEMALS